MSTEREEKEQEKKTCLFPIFQACQRQIRGIP